MLQTISWKDYSITIGLLTGLYYGWWLIRYYPSWQQRSSDSPQGKTAQTDKPAVVIAGPQETQKTEQPQLPQQPAQPQQARPEPPKPPQAEPPQPELPFAGTAQPVFLATIEANLKNDVLRLLEKASMAGAQEPELLELLHSLLTSGPYPKLKGTILQENVDALVGRELERYGSIHPAPEVIRKLWEVDG
ncbi:MAG TPA: hypothetical protein VGS79_08475 [Puia sp.]|nr:hypothetical protein [Puia sp.]